MAGSTLTDLLEGTAYRLTYAVPLLLVSLLLTFSGTFLTLDRTRSFKPHYEALTTTKRTWTWRLEGGVGGLCIGWVFGTYLSTLLSMLIPSTTSSTPLSSSSFLAVWIISTLVTTLAASRWQAAALIFATLGGGSLSILAIVIIIHPSLLTRQVLVPVFVVLLSTIVAACRFATRLRPYLRTVLRFCTGSLGAFAVVHSAATLAKVPEVADAFERWWIVEDSTWGSSKEKGLCAGFCLLLVAGMAGDWALSRFVGECPDEQWDSYLSDYTRNLPNQNTRTGIFRPFKHTGPFAFLFPRESDMEKDAMIFPPSPTSPVYPKSKEQEAWNLTNESRVWSPPPPAYLRKQSNSSPRIAASSGRKRERVKFRPSASSLPDYSSDSDDEVPAAAVPIARRPTFTPHSSEATLVGKQSKGFTIRSPSSDTTAKLQKPVKPWIGRDASGKPEYSDYESEDDVTAAKLSIAEEAEDKWQPGFIRKASVRSSAASSTLAASSTVGSTRTKPTLQPVPATASLINAIERVRAAQVDAFSSSPLPSPTEPTPSSPLHSPNAPPPEMHAPSPSRSESDRWANFWQEVRDKSEEPREDYSIDKNAFSKTSRDS